MDRFFHPKSVVIFGASSQPTKGGHQVFMNIKQYMEFQKYPDFYLIHPKETAIKEIKCYRSLKDLPPLQNGSLRIDLAIIVVPIVAVVPAVKDCIAHNVRGILIESGSLANSEKEERQFAQELKDLLRGKDIRIMGPNSIGVNVPRLKYTTPIKHFDQFLQTYERNVSIVAQSGLIVSGYIEIFLEGKLFGQSFGVSKLAAIGNKLDVNECDILEDYLNDPATHVIGMYLEDFKDGQRLLSLLKRNRTTERKPIVMLKSGRSEKGRKAIFSHTGSLAGSYTTIEALAKQYGFILVDTFEQFFGMLKILIQFPKMAGNKLGVISISGCGCVLSADQAEKYHLALPDLPESVVQQLRPFFPDWAPIKNPNDTLASIEKVGPGPSFNGIAKIFFETGLFDAIILMTISSPWAPFDWAYLKELQKKYPKIPMVLYFLGGEAILAHTIEANQHGLPVIDNLELIFKLLGKLWRFSSANNIQNH